MANSTGANTVSYLYHGSSGRVMPSVMPHYSYWDRDVPPRQLFLATFGLVNLWRIDMSGKEIATVMAVLSSFSTFSLAQSQSRQAPASPTTQDKKSKQKPVSSGDDRVITIVLPNGLSSGGRAGLPRRVGDPNQFRGWFYRHQVGELYRDFCR